MTGSFASSISFRFNWDRTGISNHQACTGSWSKVHRSLSILPGYLPLHPSRLNLVVSSDSCPPWAWRQRLSTHWSWIEIQDFLANIYNLSWVMSIPTVAARLTDPSMGPSITTLCVRRMGLILHHDYMDFFIFMSEAGWISSHGSGFWIFDS